MAKAHKAAGQPLCTASLPEGRGTWMCRVNPSPSGGLRVRFEPNARGFDKIVGNDFGQR
jgi:hypothetical protein